MRSQAVLLALPALAVAHFSISVPPGRGGNQQGTAPCAGRPPSGTRAPFPLHGRGQIQFEAGHEEAKTQVNIAIGKEDPQIDDFKVTIKDTFLQTGMGNFCWNALDLSSGGVEGLQNVENGTVATIQIVQNAIDGKLFQCADVILVDNYVAPSACRNDTGIGAVVAPAEEEDKDDDKEEEDQTPSPTESGADETDETPTPSPSSADSGAVSNAAVGGLLGLAIGVSAMYLGL